MKNYLKFKMILNIYKNNSIKEKIFINMYFHQKDSILNLKSLNFQLKPNKQKIK